ncbi:MAG TPA: hypothetical protein VFV03_08885 [Solirubrobacteraceae bacterium]|nr:hypothetical protein [Solirubrobacteraceae bacterium]
MTSTIKPLLSRALGGARPRGRAGVDGHAKAGARARMRARAHGGLPTWWPTALMILAGAALLWAIAGVGFVNYDTLYGLVWGQQLSRGEAPQYDLPIAPTPHPLVEMLGVGLAPLGAGATADITVALGFLALSACGWVIYRLGSVWFGRAAGAIAALVLLTRVPLLSYGVRAYVDIPYLLLVLSALLVETRRRRAGAPVLVLLALAGLLRPEAWAFSGAYWLYLLASSRSHSARARGQLAWLALLAAAAPAIWVLSDLLVTGDAMWSLTNTKHTAATLGRPTGIGNVPEYIPRRVGEVLRPPVLAGAALGGLLSLAWLRDRARLGAAAGVLAVIVFAAMAAAGLPIDTRYAFLTGAILCVFCGAGVFGWSALARGHKRRRPWMVAGGAVLVALLATLPGQVRSAHHELGNLGRQQSIQDDLLALVDSKAIALKCGPVGVPNHAPIPLLALYLKAQPSLIVSAEAKQLEEGTYVDPASTEVERDYMLDPRDPHMAVAIPPGFTEAHANSSWLLFEKCA